jgi:cytochrome c oxidase subunit 4
MVQHSKEQESEAAHGANYGQLVLTWLGLLALTGLTVALAGIQLGRWVIVTAITIACIKSGLVLTTFMHLKYEQRLFRIFLAVALGTFIIFIVLTFFDYAFH